MSNVIFSVGTIIKDKKFGVRYRIISIVNNTATACEMDISRFILSQIDNLTLIDLLSSGEIKTDTEEVIIFDINSLSDSIRKKYEKKKQIMNEVLSVCDASFMYLAGKTPKPEIKAIMDKYELAKNSFWRMCTSYFQSGMKDYSLVDSRAFGANKGKTYEYSTKPGAKSKYLADKGIVLNKEIRSYFEEALKDYKSGRQKSIRSSFDRMNNLHFTRTEIINGVPTLVLCPQ